MEATVAVRVGGSMTEQGATSIADRRAITIAAWLTLVGALLSGPVGVALVALTRPQPSWSDPTTLVAHWHWVQSAPFAFGFPLLAGFGLFVSVAAARVERRHRGVANAGMLFTGVGLAFASANYVAQIAYLPFAMRHDPTLVSAVAMANPRAMTWGLEMFAYGWIGVGLWLVAPAFPGGGTRRTIRVLLAFNGVASVISAAMMGVVDAWVLTPFGIVAFLLWNALVVALMAVVIVDARAR